MTTHKGEDGPSEREYLEGLRYDDKFPDEEPPNVRPVGYLCVQGHPHRICSGCTSACSERVYVAVLSGRSGAVR